MSRTLQTTARFQRDFTGLPRSLRHMVSEAAELLRTDPLSHNLEAKPLHGISGNFYRARLGEYRLVYSFTAKTVLLRMIAHRRNVYRGL